jgi:hypothetical protein
MKVSMGLGEYIPNGNINMRMYSKKYGRTP